MKTPEVRTRIVIAILDEERRGGFCDEYQIIADAFRESDAAWREELRQQSAVRDEEIEMLKQVLGVKKRRRMTKDIKAQLREAVANGLTYREAALRFGFKSPSSVHRYVKSAPQ